MADFFASSRHPSLFPMTIPVVNISKDEYRAFYKDERALFRIFLVCMHREVVESKLVMGFLLWLERKGYSSYSLCKMFVNSLNPDLISQVADEVVICIKLLLKKANSCLMSDGSNNNYNISHLQYFLDRKPIHLEELYHYADLIFYEVSCIANDISAKAFDDILEQFMRRGEIQVMNNRREVAVTRGFGGPGYISQVPGFQQAPSVGLVPRVPDFTHSNGLGQNQAYASLQSFLQNTRSVAREQDEDAPEDDRTIFLTFSKGYPLLEDEIIHYFTSMFGDFIKSLHMQEVDKPETQPLYARVVVHNPSFVRVVTERDGAHGKSKYIINGKHVWARKYVPRITPYN